MGSIGHAVGVDEFRGGGKEIGRALLAEFIGNLLLNLFGCGACVQFKSLSNGNTHIALAFGLTIFVAISAIGHVSGGHLNPAVTLGLASAGRVKPLRALLYVAAQMAGAAAGSGVLRALTPAALAALGTTTLAPQLSSVQGFGVEFFLGFILVFVVCGVCDPHKHDARATAPLAIGLAVCVGHLAAIDYTGSSMNPARSFGSAVVAGVWDDHWVYWVGPIVGGVAAALLYVHFLSAPPAAPQYRVVATEDKEMKRLGKDEMA